MALSNVLIALLNGMLGGLPQYAEGTAGIIGTGVAVTGTGNIGLNDPRLLTRLQDGVNIGLDLTHNPVAYRHISEFYAEAGDGALLYVMLVPDTVDQTQMWDVTDSTGIIQLLNYAQGKIRVAGSFFTAPGGYTLVTTAGIDADVFTAQNKAQAMAVAQAALQTPLRCLVEGRAFTGVAANLTDLTTEAYNRVATVIGGSVNDGSCGVGQVLGRLAAIPVQRKISRVKDGPLQPTQMYVGTALVDTFSGLGVMHDKGYIVPRTFPNITGYYWSGDPTAAPTTDDYCSLSRGRVIDKAAVLAYVTYVYELDDEIDLNADGTMKTGVIKTLEANIQNAINGSMTANKEISAVTAYINPAQVVETTNLVTVTLTITPVGYSTDITVDLGFNDPNE